MAIITGIWAGLVAGLAMMAVTMGARAAGLSRLPMARHVGRLIRRNDGGSDVLVRGLLFHAAASVLFGIVYGLLFTLLWRYGSILSAAAFGFGLGLVHWAVASVLLPATEGYATTNTVPIGRFAYGYGAGSAVTFLIAHLVYGTVFGWLFALSSVG